LLREASNKDVTNAVRYYHHETVRVDGQEDDTRASVRQGLDITKAINYGPESTVPPNFKHKLRTSRSSNAARRKWSPSYTEVVPKLHGRVAAGPVQAPRNNFIVDEEDKNPSRSNVFHH
jgi:hypothetical protein